MNQKDVMKLLIEASQIGVVLKTAQDDQQRKTMGNRLCQIQSELSDAVYLHPDEESNVIVGHIVDSLFVCTVDEHPKLLPNLFPAIALLCGDRMSGSWVADIDWSLCVPIK